MFCGLLDGERQVKDEAADQIEKEEYETGGLYEIYARGRRFCFVDRRH